MELTVKGKEEEIREAMNLVENIQEMIYHESFVPDACDFTVKISGEQDMRENIFFALADAKVQDFKNAADKYDAGRSILEIDRRRQ